MSLGHPTRVTLIEHPRQASWVHMNDVANAPLSASLMTGYAAAVLDAAGHEVTVVDAHLAGLESEEVVKQAVASEPELVGIHLVYDWSDGGHVAELLAALQAALGPLPLVLYGFYPTFAWRDVLARHPEVTAVIVGEPEKTIVELAADPAALASVRGLAVRGDEGRPRLTAARPLIDDLDALPFPRRTPEMLRLREVNVAGSRGCYGACTFCTINPFYGGRSVWRPRSPDSVVAEIEAALAAQPSKRRFYFVDPNFFGPGARGRERALALARMIGERFSIRFGLEGRVNDIDDQLVEALVAAGFDELLIGLESGSDDTLKRLNKHTTVEQNRRALRILRAHGIEPNVGFIMFEPGSSLADVQVNLAFLEEERLLERLAVTANVLCHQQIVLQPTPAYGDALAAAQLIVSPHNRYEGTMPYRHPEVAFLAETMAEACRHVFAGVPREMQMDEEGGEGAGTARRGAAATGARVALATVNDALIDVFRRLLGGLSSGELAPEPELAADVIAGMRAVVAEACARGAATAAAHAEPPTDAEVS